MNVMKKKHANANNVIINLSETRSTPIKNNPPFL
jgi:hypothetical protein